MTERQLCTRLVAWCAAALTLAAGRGLAATAGGGQANNVSSAPAARVVTVVDRTWGGRSFQLPASIFFDRQRAEIYVADRRNNRISVFDLDGLPVRSFIHSVRYSRGLGTPKVRPGEPTAVAVNSRGDIFVVDALDDSLEALDYRGRSIGRVGPTEFVSGEEPIGPKQRISPVAVTVDANDLVYLAVGGARCEVLVLDKRLQVVRRIGVKGSGAGQFNAITGLSVDDEGRIIVTDAQSVPVQVFSPDGTLLQSFGSHDVGWENFSLPSGAVRDGAGDLWVVDTVRQVVKRFDTNGHFQGAIGGLGRNPGDLYYPVAIAGNGDRLLFVLEKSGARFQVFEVIPDLRDRNEPGQATP